MSEFYDALETRDPAAREKELFARLPDAIARAMSAPGWAEHLKGIDPKAVTSRAALAKLPVLRKSDLPAMQKAMPPFGGLAVTPPGKLKRLLMSPGPIFEPEGHDTDAWGAARALYAAGFRAGNIVLNTFSYHLTPGGHIMDSGAQALGCAVIPAGIGNTEQQVEAIAHLKPSGYAGTPDFLKILLDAGGKSGKDVSSLKRGLVSGAALPSSLRNEPPGPGDPVAEGEVGEVVGTSFNPDYPMNRLATGDLSAVLAGQSPCGRTNTRIKGWMGRADQTTKVKGMFVHASHVAQVARRH